MNYKCNFCKFDHGPLQECSDECDMCVDCDRFELNPRLTPRALTEYEKIKSDEEWANDHSVEFDKDTAKMILDDLAKRLHGIRTDKFGNKTLSICLHSYESLRKKYLGM